MMRERRKALELLQSHFFLIIYIVFVNFIIEEITIYNGK